MTLLRVLSVPPPRDESVPPPRDALFRNDGNFQFTDVTESAGLGDTLLSLGVATADYDNNGDAGVVIVNQNASVAVLQNTDRHGHWLKIKLVGTWGNRRGIGAEVRVTQGNRHFLSAAQIKVGNDLQDAGPPVLNAHWTAPPAVCRAWASMGLVAGSSQPSCPVAAPRRCTSSRAIPKPKKLQNQMPPCGPSR